MSVCFLINTKQITNYVIISSMEDNSFGQDESVLTVFGPSLLFAGQPARWIGDSSSLKNKVRMVSIYTLIYIRTWKYLFKLM